MHQIIIPETCYFDVSANIIQTLPKEMLHNDDELDSASVIEIKRPCWNISKHTSLSAT